MTDTEKLSLDTIDVLLGCAEVARTAYVDPDDIAQIDAAVEELTAYRGVDADEIPDDESELVAVEPVMADAEA